MSEQLGRYEYVLWTVLAAASVWLYVDIRVKRLMRDRRLRIERRRCRACAVGAAVLVPDGTDPRTLCRVHRPRFVRIAELERETGMSV
jgi:hypothetical protein